MVPTSPPVIVVRESSSAIAMPAHFKGDKTKARGFLSQVQDFMLLKATQFPTDETKIAFVANLMADKAQDWMTPIREQQRRVPTTFSAFLDRFRAAWSIEEPFRNAELKLDSISQGRRSVTDYSTEFQTIASDLELLWGGQA